MHPREYKNLIFDFGGVIIDIDLQRTVDAFRSQMPPDLDHTTLLDLPVLHDFEIGKISEEDFRRDFGHALQVDMDERTFDDAWNALIIGIPDERIDLLRRLSESHRLFLLSNTNVTHYRRVSESVMDTIGATGIDHLFEGAYYSHLIRLRKPDPACFRFVLDQHDLLPAETLMLDDNDDNLAAAAELGLGVQKVSPDNTITEIFR